MTIFTAFKSAFKNAYIKLILVIIFLAIIGLSTVDNYGVSWDEKSQIQMVQWNFEMIAEGEPIPSDQKHYGVVFNLTSEGVFQVKDILQRVLFPNERELKNEDKQFKELSQLYKKVKLKHIVTFLLSLVTYVSVAGMVSILAGLESAWLGPVVLVLFPRFWGHSFFNPKDIPFAAMFALGNFLGVCLVGYYLKVGQKEIKLGINRLTLYSVFYGIFAGLVTGVRIGGLFLLFFLIIAHLLTKLGEISIDRHFFQFWKVYSLIILSWMVTTILVYPSSWSNPVEWLFETLLYLSKHAWDGDLLFEGRFIKAQSLPWYYLPKWFLITIPLIFQLTFFLGVFWGFFRYRSMNHVQRVCLILALLQVLFFPIIAILRQSTIYDGMRQFLFILPGIATISATALIWSYQKISRKTVRLFAFVLMIALFSPIVLDMVALHPYEYIYFNRISGGLAKAQDRYETEYWGLSLREGMEWINNKARLPAEVVVGGPLHSAEIFAKPDLSVLALEDFDRSKVAKPYYYLAIPRDELQDRFPECRIVHQVTRQNVPLSIVKKCH